MVCPVIAIHTLQIHYCQYTLSNTILANTSFPIHALSLHYNKQALFLTAVH